MDKDVEKELADLKRQVTYLSDRLAIQDVMARYARGLDRLDKKSIESAFHPDAVCNHGSHISYLPEFLDYAIEAESDFDRIEHNITTQNVTIDGNVAHVESYGLWIGRMPDGKTFRSGAGRYIDKMEKRNGEWKIVTRRSVRDWVWNTQAFEIYLGEGGSRRDHSDPSYERPVKIPADLQKALDAKGKPPGK